MKGFTQSETIANLTGLPNVVVQKIFDLQQLTISHIICQQNTAPRKVNKKGVDYIVPLSPYGDLEISVRGKKLICHFSPYEPFTKILKDSITYNTDLLQNKAESDFIDTIQKSFDSI
jgi:hypothetical protein